MRRLPLALLIFVLRPHGVCQVAPEAPATSTTPKTESAPFSSSTSSAPTEPNATTPSPSRATSPDLAAKISSTIPKYSPSKSEDDKKAEESPDLRETDKPRNGIIRLPKYIVQERKEPAFKERELLTPQGNLDLAYKRHPGLRFGALWFLNNNGVALFMLEEERRLERKAEMEDLAGLYRYSDPKKGAATKREADKTFIRHDAP